MDNFKIAEEKGRRKFKQDLDRHNATYEFTEDKYDNIDCFVTGNNKTFAVEIKNRDILMDTYDTYILELTKYKALMDSLQGAYTTVRSNRQELAPAAAAAPEEAFDEETEEEEDE